MIRAQYVLMLSLTAAMIGLTADGARILGVIPIPSSSHQAVMTALFKELAQRGHDITVVTGNPLGKPIKNYREIVIENQREKLFGKRDMYEVQGINIFIKYLMIWGIGNKVCDVIFADPAVQSLIHSKEKFDLFITEAFFNECLLGFAHIFQTPIVQICTYGGGESISEAVGNPNPYAYIPDFNLNLGNKMTFVQRLFNTMVGLYAKIGRVVYYLPQQNGYAQKHFGGSDNGPLPHISELYTNTSLLLVNSHFSINQPTPHMPNMIEVGGMHIKPAQKLPGDLQKFLDEATNGVVYFSMGSNLWSSEMPAQKLDALLEAFAKLKQQVLFKWESDAMPALPKNVKVSKWFPQSDLLAHPNIKVFITHGGLLSSQEAIYHGVPIVGIPIFGDQHMNMQRAVSMGFAVKIDFQTFTSNAISEKLDEVLNNPLYTNNVKELSRIFRDQPHTPLETAVFWTEYVIRHKGAYHMRSAVLDLYWFQYYLLDVLAVLGAAAFTSVLVLCLVLRSVLRCILPAKKKLTANNSKKTN